MVKLASIREWLPMVTLSPITEPAPMVVSSPIVTCSPRVARGPTATFVPIFADAGMMAEGWIARLLSESLSSCAARAKVRRGWVEIRMGFRAASLAEANCPAITAAADDFSAASRCLVSSTKTRLSPVADCRLETLLTVTEPSPRRRQSRFSAKSRRICFMGVYCRFPVRYAQRPRSGRGRRSTQPQPHKLIQRRFAGWAGFPAAMDPEPLVGILADDFFHRIREFRGVGYDVGLVVGGAN